MTLKTKFMKLITPNWRNSEIGNRNRWLSIEKIRVDEMFEDVRFLFQEHVDKVNNRNDLESSKDLELKR